MSGQFENFHCFFFFGDIMVNGMSDLIVFVCKKGIVQLMTHLVTLADSSRVIWKESLIGLED